MSRQHLLRCLANLSLNEANHAALLGSQLLPELPPAARRGNAHEQRHIAMLWANLSPNIETHVALCAAPLLEGVVSLIAEHNAPAAAVPPPSRRAAATAAAAAASAAAAAAARAQRWDEDEEGEDELDEDSTLEEARQARLLLLLQLTAELTADENTHDDLVAARLAPALLLCAADTDAT